MIFCPCASGRVLMQRNPVLSGTLLCVLAQHPYLRLLAPEVCPPPRPHAHLSTRGGGVSRSVTRRSLRGSTSPSRWHKTS